MQYAPGRLLACAVLGDFDFNWLASIYYGTTRTTHAVGSPILEPTFVCNPPTHWLAHSLLHSLHSPLHPD